MRSAEQRRGIKKRNFSGGIFSGFVGVADRTEACDWWRAFKTGSVLFCSVQVSCSVSGLFSAVSGAPELLNDWLKKPTTFFLKTQNRCFFFVFFIFKSKSLKTRGGDFLTGLLSSLGVRGSCCLVSVESESCSDTGNTQTQQNLYFKPKGFFVLFS